MASVYVDDAWRAGSSPGVEGEYIAGSKDSLVVCETKLFRASRGRMFQLRRGRPADRSRAANLLRVLPRIGQLSESFSQEPWLPSRRLFAANRMAVVPKTRSPLAIGNRGAFARGSMLERLTTSDIESGANGRWLVSFLGGAKGS